MCDHTHAYIITCAHIIINVQNKNSKHVLASSSCIMSMHHHQSFKKKIFSIFRITTPSFIWIMKGYQILSF